ncbi:MAG: flagellar protein export ATPase FliI [Bacillota bacterium]
MMAEAAVNWIDQWKAHLGHLDPLSYSGRVLKVIGLTIESEGPGVNIGDLCYLRSGDHMTLGEVVGFRKERVVLMPLGEMNGIGPGSVVVAAGKALEVRVGRGLLGRVLDGLGRPIDGRGAFTAEASYPTYNSPPLPLSRQRVTKRLATGIRAIDGLLTSGRGQRVAILAGSGVGKSTLLGMIARNTEADINVIGLVGERGREVKDFIEKDLGDEGLKRSVVVVATSDQAPLIRIKAAFVATTIAEYFRDKGMDVLLMMDSLTRFAMAQREVGLAVGEPPATRGYTPSVFAIIPRLLERAGSDTAGSITGFYTVLAEGDDLNEPVSDTVRATLDGHLVLSRKLAMRSHYPAIDVLGSVSRVMMDVVSEEHLEAAALVKRTVATYQDAEDLISIGAYVKGSNPEIDFAVERIGRVRAFLRQGVTEKAPFDDSVGQMVSLVGPDWEGSTP